MMSRVRHYAHSLQREIPVGSALAQLLQPTRRTSSAGTSAIRWSCSTESRRYFDDTYEIAVLEACVHELIELFAPRLVMGISDEISSTGDLKRVRRVGEIVAEYNATSLAGQSALDPGGDP